MATKTIRKTVSKPTTEVSTERVETPVVEKMSETVKKAFEPTDVVVCKSLTAGELILNGSKSGNRYVWSDINDETEIEYRDLANLVRSGSLYITKPLFVIEDEDFLNEFPKVRDVYEALYTIGDLSDVLELPLGEMKAVIASLPSGAQQSILNLASTMISNGRLDSLNKIKALDEMFETKLEVLTGLFED